jgi:multiple sugar transport system permease protein
MSNPAEKPSAIERQEIKWAWIFILPCLLGLLAFTYLPSVASFLLSFTYWNLLGTPEWVGLENYQQVLSDPLFWKTFGNTWIFVLWSAVAGVALGLILAVMLNRLVVSRFQNIGSMLRTAYFLPFITPVVSVALVWGWIYDPQYGILNAALQQLRLIGEPVAWLFNPQTALGAVIALHVWKTVGYNMVIFLAGLQAIPEDVYESANLDGASPWATFFRITLPMVSPTLFFVTMISFVNAFQVFDSVYLLTQGGPEHSTELMVYWMFKNAFEYYKIGPASAIAYILFLLILALTLIQWNLRKRWVLYEEETR